MPKPLVSWSTGMTVFLIALLASRAFSLQAPQRHALVIGNGHYAASPLANPVNDAQDMAEALRKLGFTVDLRTDADQRTMEDSIRAFGKTLVSGGVGLFYFAGHGIQVEGKNYLIPVGADIETQADVRYEAVDAGRVLAQMEQAENGMNIIILDACRNNPYARSFRSGETGLAKMDAPTGSILAFATAPGSVAADGNAGNGLYTSKLLVHMNDPGLKLEEVFKRVRIDVMHDSGNRQVPWESSSLVGDFYFNSDRGLKVKSVSPVVQPVEPRNTASLAPATIDHSQEKRVKLAVLPFKAQFFDDSADNQKRALDSLMESTSAFQDIALTHSYYTYGKYADGLKNITPLAPAIGSHDKDRFWGQKWGNYRPDVGNLKEFGSKNQVDLVFICKVDCEGSQRTYCQSVTINAFLYDIKKDKLFQSKKSVYDRGLSDKRSTISTYYTNDDFYVELKNLSTSLLREFLGAQ